MKALGFALVFTLVSIAAHASCDDGNEAQIVATITASSDVDAKTCKVQVDVPKYFQFNQLCPLDIDEVIQVDILVSKDGAGHCPTVGSTLSGILLQRNDGKLVLE